MPTHSLSYGKQETSEHLPGTYTQLVRAFRDPEGTFRPVPWWAWTGDMDERQVERQINQMHEQGINEFFIFPIYGLQVEYLSDAWWRKIEFTLRKCRALGMRVWIYDDYNWPSGTCAGSILRDYPELRSSYLTWDTLRVGANSVARLSVPAAPVAAYAIGPKGAYSQVTDYGCADGILTWLNTSGPEVELVVFRTKQAEGLQVFAYGAEWAIREEGYTDHLRPEPIEHFIHRTHEEYYKRCKQHWGTTLIGFFTDEPHGASAELPWTENLFAEFRARYGYDLKGKLVELLRETGDWLKTRHDYRELVAALYEENYHKAIGTWCDQHGVLYTGHALAEENLEWNVRFDGDIYRSMRWMSVPGLDMLRCSTNYDAPVDSAPFYGQRFDLRHFGVVPKLISSIARHSGSSRVMCEAFGVFPWSLDLERMKTATDWLCALGTNLINDNTLIFTIQGFVKRACSGKSFNVPYWKHYKRFSDYCGRLCLMQAAGQFASDVAVLYPVTGAWCQLGEKGPEGDEFGRMQTSMLSINEALLRTHWQFDYVFNDVIKGASPREGKLVCPHARYGVVIIPAETVLTRDVSEVLCRFAQHGGTIIVVDSLPRRTPDHGYDIEAIWRQLAKRPNVILLRNTTRFESQIDRSLKAVLNKPFEISGARVREVVASIRQYKGAHGIFLANQSDAHANLHLKVALPGHLETWGLEDGSITPSKQCTDLPLSLAPYESRFFVLRKGKSAQPLRDKGHRATPSRSIRLGDDWEFRTEGPNLLLLDTQIQTGGPANHSAPTSKRWSPVHPGGKVDMDLDPEVIPFYWLRAECEASHVPGDLAVILDGYDDNEVFVNGRNLVDFEPFACWDDRNVRLGIADMFIVGRNEILVRTRPPVFYRKHIRGGCIDTTFVEPVVLAGSFAVQGPNQIGAPVERVSAGSIHTQGFRDFAGTMVYRQTFRARSCPQRALLDLGTVKCTAEVFINGQPAGVRVWPPYTFDLSGKIKSGGNELVIHITNTPANILRASYAGHVLRECVPSGLIGPCRLLVW